MISYKDTFGRLWKAIIVYSILITIQYTGPTFQTGTKMRTRYACYNTVLDIRCGSGYMIVFGSARYGRNDTRIAQLCDTQYMHSCDVDVHFTLNQHCSGKTECGLLVSSALLDDPCGYEEFLVVTFQCIPVTRVDQGCHPRPLLPSYQEWGYIASANYPLDYYMDANCMWTIAVQKRQTIKVTIFDFELAVKRDGKCFDYLELRAGDRTHFKDCGSQGKQTLHINSSTLSVIFHTGLNSNTQRGFLLYFEAVGPGCADVEAGPNGTVMYAMHDDELWASVSCNVGFYIAPNFVTHTTLRCVSNVWNDTLQPCLSVQSTTITESLQPLTTEMPEVAPTLQTGNLAKSGSLVGIALGVVSFLLLIMLLVVLALYFHRRRKRAERKLDEMRVVFNNLQHDNAWNEGMAPTVNHYAALPSKKIKKMTDNKSLNCCDDDMQAYNLLGVPAYLDEDSYDEVSTKGIGTPVKSYVFDQRSPRRGFFTGKDSPSGDYARARSRDSVLEQPFDWDDPRSTPPPVPARRGRHRRARSGHWDNKSVRVAPPSNMLTPSKKLMTQSAPDIPDFILNSDIPRKSTVPAHLDSLDHYQLSVHANTMGSAIPHRTTKKSRSRSNSRINLRH